MARIHNDRYDKLIDAYTYFGLRNPIDSSTTNVAVPSGYVASALGGNTWGNYIPTSAERWDGLRSVTLNAPQYTYTWNDSFMTEAIDAVLRGENTSDFKRKLVAEASPDMKEFNRLLEDLE